MGKIQKTRQSTRTISLPPLVQWWSNFVFIFLFFLINSSFIWSFFNKHFKFYDNQSSNTSNTPNTSKTPNVRTPNARNMPRTLPLNYKFPVAKLKSETVTALKQLDVQLRPNEFKDIIDTLFNDIQPKTG